MMTKNRSSKKAMLKYALFFPLFVTVISFMIACKKDFKNEAVEKQVDVVPEFQGGASAMFKFLSANIKYPEEARKNEVEGVAFVGFVIEKDGSLSNVAIKEPSKPKSVDTISQVDPVSFKVNIKIVTNEGTDILDKEAIRVVQSMPKWTPGMKNGQAVRTEFTLPVSFKLETMQPNLKVSEADTIIEVDPTTFKEISRVVVKKNK